MRAMPAAITTLSPSCCAGLRQSLLQGWRQGLPLHPSPFRQMAVQSGATPRELLSTCAQLQRSGALQPIRARWGEALPRERWRLGFASSTASLVTQLSTLPGCLRLERADATAAPPRLWAEIEAIDEASLQAQLQRLSQPPLARLRLRHAQPSADGPVDGPCTDRGLAACLERGLALCANPFAACAAQLQRSERQLLASLHAWQRSGQLAGLVLAPPPPREPQPGVIALWHDEAPGEEQLAQLRALAGVERLLAVAACDRWPWRLSLVMRAAAPLALQQLQQRLLAAGIRRAPDVCARLQIEQPRDAALLFQGAG
jgi:hypothetical protein